MPENRIGPAAQVNRPIPDITIDAADEQNIKMIQAGAFLLAYNAAKQGWEAGEKMDLIIGLIDGLPKLPKVPTITDILKDKGVF